MIFKISAGLILGGVAGFLYHRLVGCRGGTCPIVRNPIMSIFYGALLGILMMSAFKK